MMLVSCTGQTSLKSLWIIVLQLHRAGQSIRMKNANRLALPPASPSESCPLAPRPAPPYSWCFFEGAGWGEDVVGKVESGDKSLRSAGGNSRKSLTSFFVTESLTNRSPHHDKWTKGSRQFHRHYIPKLHGCLRWFSKSPPKATPKSTPPPSNNE